jgi:purine-nucleoside phosphorylase
MPPLLNIKNPTAKSVFYPSALLREARRQKGLATANVPSICVLDPDGDIVRRLKATGKARLANDWPCYHTELYTFTLGAQLVGIVGCAVGAPFAVLIAEELFASDCRLLISITSAGQITLSGKPPYFVVIDRALRDEGTSYHYAERSEYGEAEPDLVAIATAGIKAKGVNVVTGSSWTTDDPFHETEEAIAAARSKGILAVEMEVVALYAFARANNRKVICLAHVTNSMAVAKQDFEKGEADGTIEALRVLEGITGAC